MLQYWVRLRDMYISEIYQKSIHKSILGVSPPVVLQIHQHHVFRAFFRPLSILSSSLKD